MLRLYTKSGCPYCASAKQDLEKKGIKYEEINLSLHPERIEEMVKLSGGRIVPVFVDENGKVTVGFGGG